MRLRGLARLLVLLLAALSIAACAATLEVPATADASPPSRFAAVDDMKRWGETSASGGGQVSKPYMLGGHTVYVTNRMHTSGVLSAELSVTALDADGKGVCLALFQPAHHGGITTRQVGNTLVCETVDRATGTQVTVLVVSGALFESKRIVR